MNVNIIYISIVQNWHIVKQVYYQISFTLLQGFIVLSVI